MIKVTVLGTIFKKEKQEKLTKLTVNASKKVKEKWINEYIDIVCFGKTKDFIDQFFHENDAVFAEADQSSYKNQEGKTYKSWVLRQINFVPKNKTTNKESENFNKDIAKKASVVDDDEDDLPF